MLVLVHEYKMVHTPLCTAVYDCIFSMFFVASSFIQFKPVWHAAVAAEAAAAAAATKTVLYFN